MQAIDTNVLIYAEITTSEYHKTALTILTELSEGAIPWAIPWPCIYEFMRVATHPRVYHPPVPMAVALQDLQHLLQSPTLQLLSETSRHGEIMSGVLETSGVTGNLVHDAHIAALCIEHGISEFISGDRDFARFSALNVTNPFSL
jgi:toxin-antitoxin system PIN domain toxin